MLSWVVTFLIVALVAGILFLVSAVVGLARGRTRV